jgi:uncharacterized protein
VWQLYRLASDFTDGVSTLLEWDARIPSFDEMHAEVLRARQFMAADQIGAASQRSHRRTSEADFEAVSHPAHFVSPEVE